MTDIRETLARAILDGMLKSGEAVALISGYAAADAVLALVGPRELEWRRNPDVDDTGLVATSSGITYHVGEYADEGFFFGFYRRSHVIPREDHPTLEAAQSAAQAHADAAHWANTALGDLIGGEG